MVPQTSDAKAQTDVLQARPYQLLCVVCRHGGADSAHVSPRAQGLPHPNLTHRSALPHAGCVLHQDPGTAEDSPEGEDFNRKRDLDILQRMNWVPGLTLPARAAFLSLLKHIPTVAGVCGYAETTAECWRGCANAGTGAYERGQQAGIAALVEPRGAQEMAEEKRRSIEALEAADGSSPHIMLCAVCRYGTTPALRAGFLPTDTAISPHRPADQDGTGRLDDVRSVPESGRAWAPA